MRTSIDNTNRLVELHSRDLADVKTKIGDLETENRLLGERLRILEERPQPCSPANLPFAEVKDRINRQSNLIVRGVQEGENIDLKERCFEILFSVLPQPDLIIKSACRIGKSMPNKPRLAKVILAEASIKYAILGRKRHLDRKRFPGIEILNDLTLQQSSVLRSLRAELARRKRDGEENLTIRYRNDEPFIYSRNESEGADNRNKRQREDSCSPPGQPSRQRSTLDPPASSRR